MVKNHYGIWVDSEKPVTGVHSTNRVNWEFMDDEICLTCEEIIENIDNDESLTDEEKEDEKEFIQCDSSHTRLIGDWLKDKDGLYYPDKAGEFAGIENESTIQVVWSKETRHCALCSPCYPGQGDIDSQGDFLAYCLPEEMYNYKED
jgi:hypothetical protein